MDIIKKISFDGLLIESIKYFNTSPVPFKFLSRVKTEGKEKALEEILTEVYDAGLPFTEEVFKYLIEARPYLETKLFEELRVLSAKEIYELDNNVFLKLPSGFITMVQAINKLGQLLIEIELEKSVWLSPDEMISKGITFEDGSPLYVSKADKVFGVEVHKKKD